MAKVTIQYWAAAREAAGVELESVEARTLAEALDVIVARRGDDGRLRSVLATSSFLVDGAAAGRRVAAPPRPSGAGARGGARAGPRGAARGGGGGGGGPPPPVRGGFRGVAPPG